MSDSVGLSRLLVPVMLLLGCGGDDRPAAPGEPGLLQSKLSAAERRARATAIRDAAAARGLTNGLLLAGIAQAETGFAHCWSEATWACQGPASTSCGGGPVIAGSGDGPCVNEQGGLGMFQFDAGTYADTLRTYGDDVLTVEGNTQQAVDFVTSMVIRSTYAMGVDTPEQALAWMNEVRVGGLHEMEWIQTVTRYYNGCVPGQCSVYDTRFAHYQTALRTMLTEMGEDFWYGMVTPPPPCGDVPAEGRTMEETDACFTKGGDPMYWRGAMAGSAGALLWTHTTDSAAPSNYASWRMRFSAAGSYTLAVYTDAQFAQSRMAKYVVKHAQGDTVAMIDQTAVDGWQTLGTFPFEAGVDYPVTVGDNTGEPGSGNVQLVADALRIRPEMGAAGAGGAGGAGGSAGGTAGTGGGSGGAGAGGGAAGGGAGGGSAGAGGGVAGQPGSAGGGAHGVGGAPGGLGAAGEAKASPASCAAGRGETAGAWLFGVLLVLGLRRRAR